MAVAGFGPENDLFAQFELSANLLVNQLKYKGYSNYFSASSRILRCK
ncbi:MAG: hypothetical protein ACI8R4_002358 [Paracoccaceae bacterium]|jgi:hypothetical protein